MEGNEFLHYQVHWRDSENNTGTFDCTPDNTELYWHAEQYSDVDHLFHRYNPRDRKIGAFLWRHILGEEEFCRVAELMIQSGNWGLHYRPVPTDADFEQYAHDSMRIPDELPDGFSEDSDGQITGD